MTMWRELEDWIYDGLEFNASGLAYDMGISREEASHMIQAYRIAQWSERSRTQYVIYRMPGTRTRSAVWRVGARTQDVRNVHRGFVDDIRRTVERALLPTLERQGVIYPRAAVMAEAVSNAVVANVELMASSL